MKENNTGDTPKVTLKIRNNHVMRSKVSCIINMTL